MSGIRRQTYYGMTEADVQVNGVRLTFGQVMALRVAVSDLLMQVCDPEYAKKLGPVANGYRERLREVEEMLIEGQR